MLLQIAGRKNISEPRILYLLIRAQIYISKEFAHNAELEGIKIMSAPIRPPRCIGNVERCHETFRADYKKDRTSSYHSGNNADCFRFARKAVNDKVRPEGLCSTLLVFGDIPRPARREPAAQQLLRPHRIDEAIRQRQVAQSKRRIAFR